MEMVVVAVVALMLFNPRELPKMLRSIAKLWGQLRATADEFKETIMSADGVDEIQELVKGTKGQIRQVENDARRELMKARAEMRKAQQKLLKANQAKLEQKQQEMAAENADGDARRKRWAPAGRARPRRARARRARARSRRARPRRGGVSRSGGAGRSSAALPHPTQAAQRPRRPGLRCPRRASGARARQGRQGPRHRRAQPGRRLSTFTGPTGQT